MSTTQNVNGTAYTLAEAGESGWGTDQPLFLAALASLGAGVLQFGNSATPSSAGTTYLHPGFAPATTSASTQIKVRVPWAGKISRLYIQGTGGSTGDTVVYTVMQNGSASTVTCTLAAAATTGADTSHSFTVAAGDAISVRVVAGASTSGGAANVVATLLFTPS